jgi:hypothetical protein
MRRVTFGVVPDIASLIRATPRNSSREVPPSGFQISRHLAAVLGDFLHDLAMQPDVHLGAVVHVAGVVKLSGQLLPGLQAAVEVERLHQVDDRGFPGTGTSEVTTRLLLHGA